MNTIKSVIGEFSVQKLQLKNEHLHQEGTPRLFIETIKAAIEQYKSGNFQVKGMSRKYPVAELEVKRVYVATATTYNWALPAQGEEVPTEILYMQTVDDVGYYYNYFNNTIGISMEELKVKDVSPFKSFVLPSEKDDPTHYHLVTYKVDNSPILSMIITSHIDSTDAAAKFRMIYPYEIVSVATLSKAEAASLHLNF